jgi:hypothetical protein
LNRIRFAAFFFLKKKNGSASGFATDLEWLPVRPEFSYSFRPERKIRFTLFPELTKSSWVRASILFSDSH